MMVCDFPGYQVGGSRAPQCVLLHPTLPPTASWQFHSAASPSLPQTLGCCAHQSPDKTLQTPHPLPKGKSEGGQRPFGSKCCCQPQSRPTAHTGMVHPLPTWFIFSFKSFISLSRLWMILLISLIRGPKLASSLSSLDFSCRKQG